MTTQMLPEMIPPREASRRTRIPYETILKMCHDGTIAHIKVGKKNILVNYTWLVQYLNTAGKEE